MNDAAATDQDESVDARELLARVRVENEADLASARAVLAGLAEDGSGAEANLTDVVAAARHMIADAEEILAEVTAAEGRMEAGTYGRCQSCGEPISEGRLSLRPYVRTCVHCAS